MRATSVICSLEAKTTNSILGQGTVEFALVTAVLLCVVLGLGALWRLFADGLLLSHVIAAASHHVQGYITALGDVFAY